MFQNDSNMQDIVHYTSFHFTQLNNLMPWEGGGEGPQRSS